MKGNAIGIDLGGTNLKSGILRPSGELIHLQYKHTHAQDGPQKVLSSILGAIEELLKKEEAGQVLGIGIGSPGQVDHQSGTVYDPPNFPGWQEERLAEIVREEFQLPTFVDNDANVAALAESVYGDGKESQYFALITLGTGVGCGIILENKIYHGATGAAGEFGHTVIKYDGPICNCGQRGCIERFVGAQWIVERSVDSLKEYPDSELNRFVKNQEVSPKIIAKLANQGDRLCTKIIEDTGYFLGISLGSLVNLLNLDLILIGGGVSNAGPILFESCRKSFTRFSLSVSGAVAKIRKASLGEKAGVIGAAHLVFETL